jgi:DNA polymerase-3 subunit delta'
VALRDIIGQKNAIEMLRGCMAKNRIAHAYLFKGEEGIGKRLTAINFAKSLNCQNPVQCSQSGAEGKEKTVIFKDCCDKCPSCIKADKASHPDIFFIDQENGQIKVGAIRSLEESLSFKSYSGKWKIAVIDNADRLNQSAANAFLKTLEEPPGQSIILLISSKPDFIPPTILSRCQIINFSPLPVGEMENLLENNPGPTGSKIGGKQARLLGLLSGGRPGWALSKDLINTRNRLFGEFKGLLSGVDEDLWPDRESMEEWFDWVQLWLRDIAVHKVTGRKDLLINHDKEDQLKDFSKKVGLRDILNLSDSFYNIKEYLRFNLNKQITLYHTYLLMKKTFI